MIKAIHLHLLRGEVTCEKLSRSALRGKDMEPGIVRKPCIREKLVRMAFDKYNAGSKVRESLSTVEGFHSTFPSTKMLADLDNGRIQQTWDNSWISELSPMDGALVDFAKQAHGSKMDEAIVKAWRVCQAFNDWAFFDAHEDLTAFKLTLDNCQTSSSSSASGSAVKIDLIAKGSDDDNAEVASDAGSVTEGDTANKTSSETKKQVERQCQMMRSEKLTFVEVPFMWQDEGKIFVIWKGCSASQFR